MSSGQKQTVRGHPTAVYCPQQGQAFPRLQGQDRILHPPTPSQETRASVRAGNNQFFVQVRAIPNDPINIVAAKLELGTRSTLARLVDGEWVLNDAPPNFQQELAKCQRYYLPIDGRGRFSATFSTQSTTLQVFVPTPVTMRTNPSVQGITSLSARVYTGAANSESLSVSQTLLTEAGVLIIFSATWPGTSPAIYSNANVLFGQAGSLSADL